MAHSTEKLSLVVVLVQILISKLNLMITVQEEKGELYEDILYHT